MSWKSVKQTCIALSTAEAEYVTLAGATQEAAWMKKLVSELTGERNEPIKIHEDNQAAISVAGNPAERPEIPLCTGSAGERSDHSNVLSIRGDDSRHTDQRSCFSIIQATRMGVCPWQRDKSSRRSVVIIDELV